MDQFDFTSPVNATVIFYDSDEDDETYDTKPFIEEHTIKNEASINSLLTVEEVMIEEANKSNINKIKTYSPTKNVIESTLSEPYDIQTKNQENIKNRIKQKLLSMPLIDVSVDNVTKYNKNINNGDEMKALNLKISSSQNKNVSKRRLTENFNVCDKVLNSAEHFDNNNKTKTTPIENHKQTDENGTVETSKKYCNTVDQTNSHGVVIHSKYFGDVYHGPLHEGIPPGENQNQNTETERTCVHNVKINPTTQNKGQEQSERQGTDDKLDHSLKEFHENIVHYLKGLLDTVSEHMIYILESYQAYVQLYKSNSNPRLVEIAKDKFYHTKIHFFDLSYSSVLNIVLPRHKDPSFINDFITNTVKISRSKSFNYTYDHFYPLYTEMVKWVQNKQEQIQTMKTNMISTPSHAQQIQKPKIETNLKKRKAAPITKSKQLDTTRESTTESFTHNMFLQNKNQHDHCTSLSEQFVQPHQMQRKPPPYSNYNVQNLERNPRQNEFYSQSTNLEGQNKKRATFTSQQDAQRQYYDNRGLNNTNYNVPTMCQNSLQQMGHQITHVQTNPHYDNGVQRETQHQNANSQTRNFGTPVGQIQQGQMQCRSSNVTSSLAQNYQHLYQILNSPQINTNHSNISQSEKTTPSVELNRSSISRDSGFMSPSNFSTNDTSLQDERMPEPSPTPLITHVTSLNPNVSLIKDGFCVVCGKITKQKCLGCYNCYYCSHDCQHLDWKIHQFVCN